MGTFKDVEQIEVWQKAREFTNYHDLTPIRYPKREKRK